MSKLKDKVVKALEADNSIVCEVGRVNDTEPFSEAYLLELGLSKSDLKKLERHGLAARRYTKNVWHAGEKLPDGKEVPEGETYTGKGRRVAWVLISR